MTPEQRNKVSGLSHDYFYSMEIGDQKRVDASERAMFAYVDSLLAQARADEREACAKVCDDAVCTYNSNEQDMLAKQLAFLIRARKDA